MFGCVFEVWTATGAREGLQKRTQTNPARLPSGTQLDCSFDSFWLIVSLFGLVRGGSRFVSGGPRKLPKPRGMALGGLPGPPEPPELGSKNKNKKHFVLGPTGRPSNGAQKCLFRLFPNATHKFAHATGSIQSVATSATRICQAR